MTQIRSLVRKSTKSDNFKAFSLFWDGGFDIDLTSTGLQLCGVQDTAVRGWEPISPSDSSAIQFVSSDFTPYGHDLTFDFIICNDRLKQFDVARHLSHKFHLPLIIIDHATPGELNLTDIAVVNQSREFAISVGCHPLISKEWDCDFTIPYGINVVDDIERDRTNDVLIHGSFYQLIEQQQPLIEKIVNDTKAKLFGHNKKLSKPFASWSQCETELLDSKIYVNLSTTHSLPRGLLLAMAHGCAVVTNSIDLTDAILDNRQNCIIIKNIEDITPSVKELLNNPMLRTKLATNARQTILDNFPMDKFVTEWKNLINTFKGTLYLP